MAIGEVKQSVPFSCITSGRAMRSRLIMISSIMGSPMISQPKSGEFGWPMVSNGVSWAFISVAVVAAKANANIRIFVLMVFVLV